MDNKDKDLVLGLLASIHGEVKRLDGQITEPSNTLRNRSDEVKKELTKVVETVIPSQPIQHGPIPNNPGFAIPREISSPPSNQLEFDLNRRVEFEDLMGAIDNLIKEVHDLKIRFDEEIAHKPKKKFIGHSLNQNEVNPQ